MLYDYLHASSLRGHLCPPWARGSAWRWAKTDTSVHHKTLRIRSAGPELVYRHPNLGAAPPPEPHRGRGRGTAILSNFSFLLGFRPHQWCRIAPHTAVFQDECGFGHRPRPFLSQPVSWTPSTSIPLASIRCRGGLGLVSRVTGVRAMAVSDVAPAASEEVEVVGEVGSAVRTTVSPKGSAMDPLPWTCSTNARRAKLARQCRRTQTCGASMWLLLYCLLCLPHLSIWKRMSAPQSAGAATSASAFPCTVCTVL